MLSFALAAARERVAGTCAHLGGFFLSSKTESAALVFPPLQTTWPPPDGKNLTVENPEAKVHSAGLTERTDRPTRSSWHSGADLMVVLGAEERRLMTKRTLHCVGKVNGFPPSCSSFTEQG